MEQRGELPPVPVRSMFGTQKEFNKAIEKYLEARERFQSEQDKGVIGIRGGGGSKVRRPVERQVTER